MKRSTALSEGKKKKRSIAGSGGETKRSTSCSDGKRKRSTARSDKRKRSTARSDKRKNSAGKTKRSTTRSAGKSKMYLKDEPKEDGPSKRYTVSRFYRSNWYGMVRGTATEIPMPLLTELAAKAVDSYNETEGLEFELVEAVKGFTVVRDDRTWSHLNFKAKAKLTSDVKFFFGEFDNEEVPTCCIIDPNDTCDSLKKCDICNGEGQVLLHPRCGTLSMFVPPASCEIHMEPPVASNMYEYALIKAGGSEEKAKKAYREFLHQTYAVMSAWSPP